MDKQKKKELAEHDNRWSLEKTVSTPEKYDWENVLKRYNSLQKDEGDLYMKVSKIPLNNSRLQQLKDYWMEKKTSYQHSVTFHHSSVYNWFRRLADELECTVGEAVHKVMRDDLRQDVRTYFELGQTVNVSVSNLDSEMQSMEESRVSKDELKEMIEDGED